MAQTASNLVRPAECFAAVEKLLMACCTMQPEDTENPRGDAEDCEVYQLHGSKANNQATDDTERKLATLLDLALIPALMAYYTIM